MGIVDVLVALVTIAGLVVAGYLLAEAPHIFTAAFGPAVDTSWPRGVQEDDDARWTWSAAAPPDASPAVLRDRGVGAGREAWGTQGGGSAIATATLEDTVARDPGADLELEPVRYAVRSPERARS